MKAKLLGVLILLLALTVGTVDACPIVVRRAVVQRAAVVQTVAIAVPVLVPAYTASYGAPDASYQQLLAELKALRAEVQQLRQGQPQVLQAQASVLAQHCADCHSGAQAKGKFTLFDGKGLRQEITPEKLGDAIAQVVSGKMPQGRKVSDGDRLKLVAELMSGNEREKK